MKGSIVALSLFGSIALGCTPDLTVVGPELPGSTTEAGDLASLEDRFAIALATALGDSTVRADFVTALGGAGIAREVLHLSSYLRSDRGRRLLQAAFGPAADQTRGASLLDSIPPAIVFVSSPLQQRRWSGGSDDTYVAFLPPTMSGEPTHYRAFALGSAIPIAIPLEDPLSGVLLLVAPAAFSDEVRSRLVQRPMALDASMAICDPDPEIPCDYGGDDDDGGAGGSSYPSTDGYNLGFSFQDCLVEFAGEDDPDMDFFSNTCEHLLATAFAPVLVFTRNEALRGRETYWLAGKNYGTTNQNDIKIMYMLGFHFDGPPFSHNGDSEFIELSVLYDAVSQRWVLSSALMSAHWQSTWFPDGGDWTEEVGHDRIRYRDSYRGRPLVYVSYSHHGLYRSESRCDSRAGDECDAFGTGWSGSVEAAADRNIGNAVAALPGFPEMPLGRLIICAQSESPLTFPGTECFWTTMGRFAGWNAEGGTTPYGEILDWYGWRLYEGDY